MKALHDKSDQLRLDPESQQLLKVYYRQFVHAGANLSDADKDKLKKLSEAEILVKLRRVREQIDRLSAAVERRRETSR